MNNVTGTSVHARLLSYKLPEAGVNVQPILYPAVEETAARLRFFINCTHTEEQILTAAKKAAEALQEITPAYFRPQQRESA